MSPRSEPVVAIATAQPWLGSPSTSASGTNTSSRNTSAKPSSPSSRSTGRTVTPGDDEVDEEVREAAVPFGVGIAAEQAEEMRAERAARRPRLLAVEPPAAVRLVACRLALDPGEVAARVRLRPSLAPRLLARGHLRQDAVLLLLRAELEDRGREQEDAVLRDALRRARGVVLLFEDQPLPERSPRGRRTPGATRPPRTARRTACAPTRGARRSRPGCRPKGARAGARVRPASRGTRRGTAPRRG